jgi:hypothetical protein
MRRQGLGLTDLYNAINDPSVQGDADIVRLREIHVALDEALLAAYGWQDLKLNYGFSEYRQLTMFTASAATRAELLARLLAENHRRAAADGLEVSAQESLH